MAAEAAIRVGAGYATVAVPADLEQIFEVKLTEVMSRGFAGAEGRLAASSAEAFSRRRSARPPWSWARGWGATRIRWSSARTLARRIEAPLLIDADGLNAHAERLDSIAERAAPTVLTPHAGELGRLLGRESGEVAEHRLACAREAAERSGAIVVLKGDDSLVVDGAAACDRRRGEPGARHRRHRRRALGHDRGAARARHGALRGHLRRRPCAPARRQDRRRAAGRGRVGDRDRRDRRSAGGAPGVMRPSCESSAPWPWWTRARWSATAPGWSSELDGARLCAVVKANGYGHGAVECARAALAGGATWLAVAAAAEAAELRGQLPDARLLTMGALTEAELELALGAESDVAAWRRGFARLARRARGRAGRPPARARQVRHRHGPPRRARPGRGARPGGRGGGGRSPRPRRALDPLRHRRRARLGLLRRAARALRPARRAGAGRAPRSAGARRQQRRHAAGRRLALRHGSLRDRDLRPRPLPGRSLRPRARAGARAALLRRRHEALSGRSERRLRPALARPRRHLGRGAADRLRGRRSPRAHQQRRGAGRRQRGTPWSAPCRWTT